ncbi:MAG TPA: hypothetical protein VNQ56_02850 [Pseudolabrys sp.]|nr:hypothetical protein [Pseudolabrys sp.]
MRTFILTSLAAAGLAVATVLSAPAFAAPLGPSSGLKAAAQESSLTHEAAYVCRRVWRHGRWERRCWWRPGPRYYGGYGYYGPRPYYGYRNGWRHRPYYRRW